MRRSFEKSISRSVFLALTLLFALMGGVFAATASAPLPENYLNMEWPLPPNQLEIESVTATAVTISWTASKSTNIVNYLIFRNGVQIASVSGATLSFTDKGVARGKTYTYTVKSKNNSGQVGAAGSR
jgi:cytochrome c oxidase assembly factor CtaG